MGHIEIAYYLIGCNKKNTASLLTFLLKMHNLYPVGGATGNSRDMLQNNWPLIIITSSMKIKDGETSMLKESKEMVIKYNK